MKFKNKKAIIGSFITLFSSTIVIIVIIGLFALGSFVVKKVSNIDDGVKIDNKFGQNEANYLNRFIGFVSMKDSFNFELSFEGKIGVINNYFSSVSADVSSKNWGCFCYENCGNYENWIRIYSQKYNIDPLLAFSIMVQESGCRMVDSEDGKDHGLMQINDKTLGDCSEIGGVEEIKTNPEKNIECGFKVLKDKYNQYAKSGADKCDKTTKYFEWDAALRGYNGVTYDCSKGDKDYVEHVNSVYSELHGFSLSIFSINEMVKSTDKIKTSTA